MKPLTNFIKNWFYSGIVKDGQYHFTYYDSIYTQTSQKARNDISKFVRPEQFGRMSIMAFQLFQKHIID